MVNASKSPPTVQVHGHQRHTIFWHPVTYRRCRQAAASCTCFSWPLWRPVQPGTSPRFCCVSQQGVLCAMQNKIAIHHYMVKSKAVCGTLMLLLPWRVIALTCSACCCVHCHAPCVCLRHWRLSRHLLFRRNIFRRWRGVEAQGGIGRWGGCGRWTEPAMRPAWRQPTLDPTCEVAMAAASTIQTTALLSNTANSTADFLRETSLYIVLLV